MQKYLNGHILVNLTLQSHSQVTNIVNLKKGNKFAKNTQI